LQGENNGFGKGELIEILIAANLWEKFPEYDLQRAYRRLPVYDEKNIIKAEVDILLVNTEWAMAVDVKRQANAEDVKEHLERMERILKYLPGLLPADVKLLGALAGGIVTGEARAAACSRL
jgi:predicted AAA+ superfamily ATPase